MSHVLPRTETRVATASPALAPPPGHPRFPLVDSLRGAALVGVIVLHASGATNALDAPGWGRSVYALSVGLTLFFVLSGFLLYRPFVAGRSGGAPAVSARDYGRRRAARILPAYWFALAALAVWPGVTGADSVGDFLRLAAFGQIYEDSRFIDGIPVAWSLCVEVTFYALLPLYAFALAALTRSRPATWVRYELLALAGVAALSIAIRVAVKAGALPPLVGWTLAGNATWFAVGMALAVLSVATREQRSQPGWVKAIRRWPGRVWAAALVIWLGLVAIDVRALTIPSPARQLPLLDPVEFIGGHLLGVACAALVLAPAVFAEDGNAWPHRLMRNRWLAWIGVVSYGAYLWHAPAGVVMAGKLHSYPWLAEHVLTPVLTLLMLGVGITAGAFSYYVVELPFLRRKERRRGEPGARWFRQRGVAPRPSQRG